MRWFRKLFKAIQKITQVETFLDFLDKAEGLVAMLLSLAMVVVLTFTVFDLGVFLFSALYTHSDFRSEKVFIIEIFGLFLNILIALELLENITAYLRKHVIQVELVFITALIAGARKIIILDLEKVTGLQLLGLAAAILALAISYWLLRQIEIKPHDHDTKKQNQVISIQNHSMSNFFKFETDFVDSLRCIPMQVRMKLDTCGIKLKLPHWHQFSQQERQSLVEMPCETDDEVEAYGEYVQQLVISYTGTPASELPIDAHPSWLDAQTVPDSVQKKAQEFELLITHQQWEELKPEQRFALIKLSRSSHENKNFLPALQEFSVI
jgi:hypothetical protein